MKKILSVLAFVAVLAAPASAFAAVNGPTTTGGSDVFVAVTNNTTGASAVIDLGVTASQLSTLSSQSFTLDAATLTALGSSSALTYQVFANNGLTAATGVLYTTFVTGSSIPSTGTNLANQLNSISTWFTTNQGGFAAASGLQTVSVSGLNSWSQTTNANGPGATYQLAGFNAQAAVGSAIDLFSFTGPGGRGTGAPTQSASFGTFTLSGNTLSFVSAAGAQTPLPAAAWLLASGLLGFGGVSRRRRQTLAA